MCCPILLWQQLIKTVGRRTVRRIIGGGYWFLAFWREAKISISWQVDSGWLRHHRGHICPLTSKSTGRKNRVYILCIYIYICNESIYTYLCMYFGGDSLRFLYLNRLLRSQSLYARHGSERWLWKTPENGYPTTREEKKKSKKRCIIIMRLVFRANLQFMPFSYPKQIREISRDCTHS